MDKKIGICDKSYPSKRMIINKVPGCKNIQVKQTNRFGIFILLVLGKIFKKFRLNPFYAKYVHFILKTRKQDNVDFIHTFNRIYVGDDYSWGGTFEKTFPEYFCEDSKTNTEFYQKQARYIFNEKCMFLLPLSKWAYDYEISMLSQWATKEELEIIRKKMEVIYPPQPIMVDENSINNKYVDINNRELTFIYVGGQIKRKGGLSVLRVFERLAKDWQFKLIFIGDFNNGYNSYFLTEEEKKECSSIINNSKWIEHYNVLPNNIVLEKMKNADVGLLPTIGDTFGFSVLEMQASGCPVVTTNRQAMPEINNAGTGWIINTRRINVEHGDDYGNYIQSEIDTFLDVIDHDLFVVIESILKSPSQIKNKAICSLEKVQKDNSPSDYAKRLTNIYLKM